ncbi:MAG: hypothetical protein OEW15_09750 [Nitrospirota bacterium]|nr:hypothetical protein [Nitrospirota bacterium]
MDKRLEREIDRQVENYRRAMLYLARTCDWDEFKTRAGGLFDYLEQVEALVRERKFFQTFFTILAFLVVAALLITGWDPGDDPALQRFKQNLLLMALAASSFELFFYINFRKYVEIRASLVSARREAFIRNMLQDFRKYAEQQMMKAA